MTYKWNYPTITPQQAEASRQLAQALGISPILARLLTERGITTVAAARKFFRPQLPDLHDPFLMKDMDVAVNRLNKAMGRKERILIYGDYDVDGTTAVALVYKFIQQYYSNIDYYIPDRYNEGYGVSMKGVDYAAETGVKLVIVLDCGIKAVDEVTYAREKGIDFIICDHHVPDDVLPPAVAILNAKREDNTYPYEHLSGCGVGFKFMQAFALSNGIEFHHLIPLLDLVAVSIASDIVPIMGENRILAFHGLKQLNSNPSVGLKAIIDVCGLTDKELTVSDIVFKIGPRINASGRIQNGKEAVDLLTEKDFSTALEKQDKAAIQEEITKLRKSFHQFFNKDYAPEVDKKIAKVLLKEYRKLVPAISQPAYLLTIDQAFGGNVDAFVDHLFAKSIYGSVKNFEQFATKPTRKALEEDPMIAFARSVKEEREHLNDALKSFDDGYNLAHRTYVEGLLRMHEGGQPQWPDANFTLRLTYGQIKGYSPRDCDYYGYQTTLEGVMEKEDSTNWEFVVPAKLKELYKHRDFGPYATKQGTMPVALCATTHTTGGNSGSPVLNARGELIGLNFDRNWEGVGGDIEYLPDYQRSIIVDIRYVLFLIDKYAGADYLLDELEIVK